METKDIIGKKFTCFKFESDLRLSWTSDYEEVLGKTGKVLNIHPEFPKYANVKVNVSSRKTECLHFPTEQIKEQLEKVEYDNKSIEELLNEMKQLISRI
jgi:hypothetical protein